MSIAIIGQIVAGLLGIAALWLKEYNAKDRTYERIQDNRQDILANPSVVIDRVLADSQPSCNSTGEPSTEDVEGRLSKL